MSKYTFVMGAGASADAGVPMMGNFLERADDLLRQKKVESFRTQFELALSARSRLSQTHSKATSIDIYNMEAVFSAFEMAQLIKKLGDLSKDEIQKLPAVYRILIAETIEQSMVFQVREGRYISPPKPYESFANSLKPVPRNELSLITFNYDIAIDYALNFAGIHFDYCLDEGCHADKAKLIKLHGSLNWGEREVDGKIYPAPIQKFFNFDRPLYGHSEIYPTISKHITMVGNQDKVSVKNDPIIVPPTWNKANHNPMFENIWKHAADSLGKAEHIFILGYSLPDSDQFFKYLYALGTTGDTIMRNFWVFDPEPSVEIRFRNLLSPSMLTRFKFFKKTFAESIADISRILPKKPQ